MSDEVQWLNQAKTAAGAAMDDYIVQIQDDTVRQYCTACRDVGVAAIQALIDQFPEQGSV